MIELDFPLIDNSLVRVNTCEDFIRFDVYGYIPEYKAPYCNDPSSAMYSDPGTAASIDDVKAFLVVKGEFVIELNPVQSELAFQCYEKEFFQRMKEQEKYDAESRIIDYED